MKMSKIREIDVIRMSKINVLDGVTETTTVRELYEKVSVLAERWEEEEKKRKEEEKARKEALGEKYKEKDVHIPAFLAVYAKPLLVSKDHTVVVFDSGDVYYRNEVGETVIKIEKCCKEYSNSPDFDGTLDPRKMTYRERQMSSFSSELMGNLSWQLTITMVADDRCRANGTNRKGDRYRTDNVVMTDEGEELDLFESYYDDRSYCGIDDEVIDKMETLRLRDVAFEGFTDRQVEIMDGVLAGRRHDDIAADLGVARGTVSKIVMRKCAKAHDALRAEMDKKH